MILIGLSIYIVATANYYNFMDGINGIAAITGVVGFGLLSFYAFYTVKNPKLITSFNPPNQRKVKNW